MGAVDQCRCGGRGCCSRLSGCMVTTVAAVVAINIGIVTAIIIAIFAVVTK